MTAGDVGDALTRLQTVVANSHTSWATQIAGVTIRVVKQDNQ